MKNIRVIVLVLAAVTALNAGRSFNGSTDQASVSGVSTPIDITGTQISASCWFRLTAAPSGEVECYSKWASGGSGGYLLNYNQSGNANEAGTGIYISISLNHLHQIFCTATAVNLNQWYNITLIYQNSVYMKAWIATNGVSTLCGTDNGVGSSGAMVSSGNNLLFGANRGSTICCFFQGVIGRAAVWNVALSPSEAQALAVECPGRIRPTRLVGLWNMDGVSGTSIEPDSSGSKLNATLTGTTASSLNPPCQI